MLFLIIFIGEYRVFFSEVFFFYNPIRTTESANLVYLFLWYDQYTLALMAMGDSS